MSTNKVDTIFIVIIMTNSVRGFSFVFTIMFVEVGRSKCVASLVVLTVFWFFFMILLLAKATEEHAFGI